MISLKNTLKELSTRKQDMEWKELYSGSSTSVTISNISRYNEMVVYTRTGDFVQSTYILLNQPIPNYYDISSYFSGSYYASARLSAKKSGDTLTLWSNKYYGVGWGDSPIENVFAR